MKKMSPQARLPLRLRHLIITVRPQDIYFNTNKFRINGIIKLNRYTLDRAMRGCRENGDYFFSFWTLEEFLILLLSEIGYF